VKTSCVGCASPVLAHRDISLLCNNCVRVFFTGARTHFAPKRASGPLLLTRQRSPTNILFNSAPARAFMMVPAQAAVAKYIESFKDFPPRTKPASFTIGDVMDKLTASGANKN
jgi:hypothetical protein